MLFFWSYLIQTDWPAYLSVINWPACLRALCQFSYGAWPEFSLTQRDRESNITEAQIIAKS